MPLYNYRCTSCDHSFDDLFKIDDRKIPETKPCPKCGADNSVHQCVGSPNIVSSAGSHLSKVPIDFRNHMSKMKSFYKGSNINV